MRRPALIAAFLAALAVTPAGAVNPDEVLADPALEARARAISEDIRCVVCRNQNIDSSNAGIARDMRLVLRERLVAGDTDAEAVDYLVDRFGSFILLRPPLNTLTVLLWSGPFVILGLIVWGFVRTRHRAGQAPDPEELSDEDRRLLARLTAGEDPAS